MEGIAGHIIRRLLFLPITLLVVFLYALTPSLRWEEGQLHVSGHVRRHISTLAGVLLVLLAWSYRLDAYGLLREGTGPLGALSAVDHKLGIPANLTLAMLAIAAAMLVTWSGWIGQTRVAFVTITVMLLAGVTILVRGAIELAGVGPGFDASRVITLRIDPVQHIGRVTTPPPNTGFVLERFAAVSGVESVALGDGLIGSRNTVLIPATGDVAAYEQRRVSVNPVTHQYFSTVGLRLIDGRGFHVDEQHGAPVAIVSEVFARQNFPEGRAIGRALRIGTDTTERTIVGVVSNVLLEGIRRQASPIVYVPASIDTPSEAANSGLGFLVRFTPGTKVIPDLHRALAAVEPLRTIAFAAVVRDALAAGAAEVRVTVYLAGPLILLALALTMSGIYGLLAQTVTHRTHEVALRVALGAERRDVLGLIVFQGLKLTTVGAIAGAAGALALDRMLGSFVLGVPGERPVALATATLLIVLATIIASIVPCLRALHIDPASTLRYE